MGTEGLKPCPSEDFILTPYYVTKYKQQAAVALAISFLATLYPSLAAEWIATAPPSCRGLLLFAHQRTHGPDRSGPWLPLAHQNQAAMGSDPRSLQIHLQGSMKGRLKGLILGLTHRVSASPKAVLTLEPG